MGATRTAAIARTGRRLRMWSGIVLLAAGLSGHLLAARAIGGYYVAYRDHIGGFVLLTVVTGAVIALLGRRFWRGRLDYTLLLLGVVQAIFGLVIYINRFNIR